MTLHRLKPLFWTGAFFLMFVLVGGKDTRGAAPESRPAIPSPREVFGFDIGEDYHLADYDMMLKYFRILDERSERIKVVQYGQSVRGRPLILAIITSPENHRQLAKFKEISRRLALADVGSDDMARQLAAEGKAILWIDSGLHATEIAHAQHAIELAYELATRQDEEIRFILDRVILLLAPCVNPDGMDLVVEWYWKHQNLRIPELYHVYIGHDNNRDFIMMTQPETRAIARILYREWFPQILINHHQAAPRGTAIFVPPFADPFNPNIDPLIMRGIELVASAMKYRYEEEGKAGVISREIFSTWWNGGLRTAAYYHNIIGILTETGIADPAPVEVLPPSERLRPMTNYPNPLRQRTWHFKDTVQYVLTASYGALDIAARYRERLLYNMYRLARRAIEKGRHEPPYGYILPSGQVDPSRVRELVNLFIRAGVNVERLTTSTKVQGVDVPAGSFVIRTDQPFRAYILDLMEPQRYPDLTAYPGGPPIPPYDMAGWTLRYQMDVKTIRLTQPISRSFRHKLKPLTGEVGPDPVVLPDITPRFWLLSPERNDAYHAVFRLLKAGIPVYRTVKRVFLDDRLLPPGTFLIPGAAKQEVRKLAKVLGVAFDAPERSLPRDMKVVRLRLPKIGLYDVYGGNIDEGWTRWLLEQYEIPYRKIWGGDLRKNRWRETLDVLVIPHGILIGTERRTRTAPRSLSFTGPLPRGYENRVAMGPEGVRQVAKFVDQGGTVITLGSSSMMAIRDLHVPVRNVLMKRTPEGAFMPIPTRDFFGPGSVLEVEFDATHPIAFGMPRVGYVYFDNSPTFEIEIGGVHHARVVARYPARNPLKSGWIRGARHLYNRAAIVDVIRGRGHVILFGPRIQFRAMPHGTFKLLFNALLEASAEPARWPG